MEKKLKTVRAPSGVVEVMAYAEATNWWPFDAEKDLKHFLKCWTLTAAKIHLFEAFIKYETWVDDQPQKKKWNHRLGFLNWCLNAKKYKERAAQPFVKPAPAPSRQARGPAPAGVQAGVPVSTKLMDIAACVAKDKAIAGPTFPRRVVSAPIKPAPPPPNYPQLTPAQAQQRRREQLAWANSQKGKK